MDKHLHIVSLEVPWPADYGGVVDLFYKIKSLHRQGVKIHLHCFTKNRPPQAELNKYCETVTYYQRKANSQSFSFKVPLIVNSRVNNSLLSNLQKDNHPILLEGIHCTYFLFTGQLKNRKVVVRLHNAEFEYYRQLANNETGFFKRLYYRFESRLLKNYEKTLAGKACFLAVSQKDEMLFKHEFRAPDIHYLPVFLPYNDVTAQPGQGSYCLYHGNLAVNENEEAAIWLLKNVFNTLELPFVIAGRNPSKKLQQLAHMHQHTCIVTNPGEKEMQDMIAKAQVHILPSLNNTGVKLKLLNALFNGRHCVANKALVEGSGLADYCHVANDATAFRQTIADLFDKPFDTEDVEKRKTLLDTLFHNEKNTGLLIKHLW